MKCQLLVAIIFIIGTGFSFTPQNIGFTMSRPQASFTQPSYSLVAYNYINTLSANLNLPEISGRFSAPEISINLPTPNIRGSLSGIAIKTAELPQPDISSRNIINIRSAMIGLPNIPKSNIGQSNVVVKFQFKAPKLPRANIDKGNIL